MKTKLALEEIYAPIEAEFPAVEEKIYEILQTPNELTGEVIRYFFKTKGKFLRPALSLLSASFAGEVPETVIQNAAALEIFHSATLIHDDIIDSAYLRRNLPTINSVWGPQVAVLVGDFLHDKAIGAIFSLKSERAMNGFLETAGLVCDGEILELREKNNFNLTEEQYIHIVKHKTAVLLACCIETNAILAGLPESQVSALKSYGLHFGISFQIIDDCLDFSGKENEFGKTLGADLAAGVLTLPLIRLLTLSDEATKQRIRQIVQSGARDHESLNWLIQCLQEFEALEYAFQKAREYTERARLDLAVLDDHPAKKSLGLLLDYVLERNR